MIYRNQGATKAAKLGAVAALIRSVTPYSMYTLHTGQQSYQKGVKNIPVASITVEDARMLQRYQVMSSLFMLLVVIHYRYTKSKNFKINQNVDSVPRKVDKASLQQYVNGYPNSKQFFKFYFFQ